MAKNTKKLMAAGIRLCTHSFSKNFPPPEPLKKPLSGLVSSVKAVTARLMLMSSAMFITTAENPNLRKERKYAAGITHSASAAVTMRKTIFI